MSRKRNDDKAMCAFVPVVVAAAAAVDGGGDKAIWNAISHFPGVKLKCTNHHQYFSNLTFKNLIKQGNPHERNNVTS